MYEDEIRKIKHFEKRFAEQKRLFSEAARESVVVQRAIDIVTAERLPEEYAWLEVANYLIEENRRLTENAVMALSTSARPYGAKIEAEK